jgi:uncharacterized cupredoxin-like copper-binding protein
MFKKVATVSLAGAVVLAGYAALGQAAPAKPVAPKAGRIAITAREFSYEPNQFSAKAGETTLAVKNAGAIDHDLTIEDAKNKTVTQGNPFAAGRTMEVKVKLEPGTYSIFCSMPGHREAGMSATLKVAP